MEEAEIPSLNFLFCYILKELKKEQIPKLLLIQAKVIVFLK